MVNQNKTVEGINTLNSLENIFEKNNINTKDFPTIQKILSLKK